MRKLLAIAAILLATMMLPLPQIVGANHRSCATESVIFTPPASGPVQVGAEWDGILFDGEDPSGAHVFVMFLSRIEEHNRPAGSGTWYAICHAANEDFAQGPNNPVMRALNNYRGQNPSRWVQLIDMRSGSYHLSAEFNRPAVAPSPQPVSPAPFPAEGCAQEAQIHVNLSLEQTSDGRVRARNLNAPPGWIGLGFDGRVSHDGPHVFGVWPHFVGEAAFVEGTILDICPHPEGVMMRIAEERARREPNLRIEVWSAIDGPVRRIAVFNQHVPLPAAPAPAPAVPGTAECIEESRELVPLLSQAWDGRVRAVVFPPVDFPTSGIVFEGLPWRDSPVHIELHRPQAMEVVYHSGTFRAVCVDPMTIAQRLWETHRIAGRWVQVWDVRPSGPRVLIVEFNRPPHIPSAAAPTAPAQCLEPTPSRRGIPPESGDDLAFDLPVIGPAVVQVQWSGLVARPAWAQDRTVLTVVPHQWEGIFQKVRNVTVWTFSPLCSPEHVNRELARAAERSGFEIRGIEEIRGSGLFVKTIKTN